MSSRRAPSQRAAALAANKKISHSTRGGVQVAASKGKRPDKTFVSKATAATRAAAKRSAILAATKEASKKVRQTDSQKVMSLEMWLSKNTELIFAGKSAAEIKELKRMIEKEHEDPTKYHVPDSEYQDGLLMYRYTPGKGPFGSGFAVQEPRTKTWRYFESQPFYVGAKYGFPEGFSREHADFNIVPVWRYGNGVEDHGEVMMRLEHKASKLRRLIPVKFFEKGVTHGFLYPKRFVSEGEEGNYSTHGRAYSVDFGGLTESSQ